MMKHLKAIIVMIIVSLCASMANAEYLYYVTLFEPQIGGGYATYAESINDSGVIVGSTWCETDDGWQYKRATIFDYTGGGADIDLGPFGRNHSEAHAVSNNGNIVGEASTGGGTAHVTIFDSSGGGNNTDLGEGYAFAVNNNLQVVGRRGDMAFLWDQDNGMRDLGTLGGDNSSAWGINENGDIVGNASTPYIGKRSGKCILSLRRDFGILTFVIVILLETGAGDYGCQKKKTYQAGLVSGF